MGDADIYWTIMTYIAAVAANRKDNLTKDNAVFFLLFAFDKDSALYFAAGNQSFGDKSGLLY